MITQATAVLGFLVAVAYVPGISGASTSPRWIVLSLGVAALLCAVSRFSRPRGACTPIWWLLGWLAVTAVWSEPYEAYWALWLVALFAGLFLIGTQIEDMRPIVLWFSVGVLVAAAFAPWMPGEFSFYAGLFAPNPVPLGEAAALAVAGCIACRILWATPFLFAAVLASGSRGALLSVLTVGAVLVWQHRPRWLLALVPAGAAAILGSYFIGVHAGFSTVTERLAIWKGSVADLTMAGHGLGSFYGLFPRFAEISTLTVRPDHAHNEDLHLLFEAGLIGAGLFALACCALYLRAARHPEALVLCAVCPIALVSFPFHMPATLFLVALVAGRLCGSGCSDGAKPWNCGMSTDLERNGQFLS